MKKIYITLFLLAIFGSVSAQWLINGSNVYINTGIVGIGTNLPTHSLTFASVGTGAAFYNVADQTINFERLVQQYQSNAFTIGSYFGGSATARSIKFGIQTTAGTATLAGGRVFTINPYIATTTGVFDFNATIAGAGSLYTLNTNINGSGVQQSMLAVEGTVNQTSSGSILPSYTALLIAPYQQAFGTGNNYLIDAGINTAASGGGTHTPFLLLTNTGNLGIGTTDNATWNLETSPYKLAVGGGGIISTSVTVKTVANWPDYVFRKNYLLPSLDAIKTYLDVNQHLPEFPSGQQLSKDGVDLGEMNEKLVKKVEELTLYLIQMNKQLKKQQREINRLKHNK